MRYSNEVKEKAIEYYLVGYSAQMISNLLGPNEATVRSWLKERNISVTIEITEKLHLKRGIVSYLLRKYDYGLNHRGPKSKIGNENYFDVINTSDKAYFLGWLMADGNISINNGQYSIKIHIAYKDKEIIDNFLECIKSTNKTKVKESSHKSYYVSLTSKHMCKALMKYGMLPHKTGKEIISSEVPIELKKDFIRGVFDGDGITDVKNSRSGFVGSYNLVNSILFEIGQPNIKIYETKSKGIYYFLGGKKFSKHLFNYMYEDTELYLKRKYERLKYICNS